MKNILKLMPVFVIFLILVTLVTPICVGDGGGFYRLPTIDTWLKLPQEKQVGIINYKDGYEKLILIIDVKNSSLQGEEAVWIFPVPADPNDVTIDILNNIPHLRGTDVRDLANDAINDPYLWMYFSQLYTTPLIIFLYASGMMAGIGSASVEKRYTVFESIEKWGMTTEKVGAEDAEAFSDYLNSSNLSLPEDANITIDEYIGEDYCFIVSWISDVEEFRKYALITDYYYYEDYYYYHEPYPYYYTEPFLMLGVSINFPTEKIYYPLKLTSVYGNEEIPILIQIMDYVTPSSYPDISLDGFMTTNYFIDKSYSVPANLTTFFAEQIQQGGTLNSGGGYSLQNLKYTEISIRSKARFFTEDLLIDDSASGEVAALDFVANNGLIILILIFILISCLSSFLAGISVYRRQKPCYYKFALFGLFNFTSIIGFFIASFVLKIDQRLVDKPLKKKESKKDVPIKWILIGVLLTFVVLISFIALISMQSSSFYRNPFYYLSTPILFLLLIFGPIIGTIAMFIYGIYRDKQKTAFTVMFSLLFMFFLFVFQLVFQAVL